MSIKVNNVSFTYLKNTPNVVKALDNVTFELQEKKITAIVGHTGSGKSTFIQMLNALLLPEEGTIEIGEFSISSEKKKGKFIKDLRQKVSIVFQFPEYQLFEETVEKDVAFGLKNFGLKEDEAINRAHEALTLVGLDESFYKRSPFDLSGGEKRRVAIAGILVLDPNILILDEPTAGLDPEGTRVVLNLIKKLNSEGKTIILVSHDMDIVLELADEVLVLKNGKNVFQGSPFELFNLKESDLSLDIPHLYKFAQSLIDRGVSIDMKNVHNIDDLFAEVRGNNHD